MIISDLQFYDISWKHRFESLSLRKKEAERLPFFALEGMRIPEWRFVIDEVACQSKNPTLSAEINLQGVDFQSCRFFLCPKRCTINAPEFRPYALLRAFSSHISILSILLCDIFNKVSVWQHEMRRVFFLPFSVKKCTKKRELHLLSPSNLKIIIYSFRSV